MNRLTSQNRKLVYLGVIVLLLIPVIWLGRPADSAQTSSGGVLAQLRNKHKLGETTLGEVDPSSATMNLVLLGMRGVATNVLWLEHDDFKAKKDWPKMRAAAKSIILLQPHYLQVWRYQGWDLAYNVSAEWDLVRDRYYWVKEGGKFTMEGSKQNALMPELYWDVGRILGQKVGRSDEWQYFRKYFREDPDPKFTKNGIKGPDPEFARDPSRAIKDDDNYLCAKEWYFRANEAEAAGQRQHIMMKMLFRQYPARSQFDYADALQRDGGNNAFTERSRLAWDEAYDDWTTKYRNGKEGFGKEEWESPGGTIILEADDSVIRELARKDGISETDKRRWVDQYQKTSNYRFWRLKAQFEREPITVKAHQEIAEGQRLFKDGRHREAIDSLQAGMADYARALSNYVELVDEDLTLEEGLMAMVYWRYALRLLDLPVPEQHPLKALEDKQKDRVPEIERRFRQENGIQQN